MNRRGFLKGLALALAASQVPIGKAMAAKLPTIREPEISANKLCYIEQQLEDAMARHREYLNRIICHGDGND